jgi:cell division GTPase FtsZ
MGAVIREDMAEELTVTVIATGFGDEKDALPGSPSSEVVQEEIGVPAIERKRAAKIEKLRRSRLQGSSTKEAKDQLDVPAFIRKRLRS